MAKTKEKKPGRGARSRPAAKQRVPRTLGGFFLRGLVTLLPVVLTIVVFGLLFQMVNRYVTGPINDAIYWSLERNALGWKALDELNIDPLSLDYLARDEVDDDDILDLVRTRSWSDPYVIDQLQIKRSQRLSFFRDLDALWIDHEKLRSSVAGVVHPVIGVLISILVVLSLGWTVGGFVGRRIVQSLDQAMHKIPGVRSVYPYSKQLVEFFFAEKKLEFDTVVAVPYPSPGIWSIAFVTGDSLRTVREQTGKPLITCFVPSSPMPMTGYTIFVDAARVIPLPISVDEALRITMTGGVLVPPHETVELLHDLQEDDDSEAPPTPASPEDPS
ncbi:MAG TPA: DUF502 domain-containing protein [Planctomycetes bacterium]|nr:DUF502 domain-containing protein [Planctomycetota bacterium]